MTDPKPEAADRSRESDRSALAHSCDDTKLYVLSDVTVYVRLFKDGRTGGVKDSKASITKQALESVGRGDDVVCLGCGWMGRWL